MHMKGMCMNVRKAFEEGRFLEIADSGEVMTTPEDRLILGIALFKVGRENDAAGVFERLSSEIRERAKALYYLTLLSRKRGDYAKAQLYLDQYRVFFPEDDDALELLESGDDEQPLVSVPSLELAREYARQGHYEQARDIYARVLESTGYDPEIAREGRRIENLFLLKTLHGWLERVAP